MEENNQNSAIKIAIGVIMTLILVGAMITLFLKVIPSLDKANNKIDSIQTQMDMIYFNAYNNTTVSGSDVVSAINTKASSEVTVIVKTKSTSTPYNSASYNVADRNDDKYIEPTAKFSAVLGKNTNGSVNTIVFTQN